MTADSTKRFSNRVEDYIKYRPSYPVEIIETLEKHIGLSKEKIIADVGSGTGISSEPFLKNGNLVYGVEPNKEMREAQENILSGYPRFESVNGTAENTNLKENSIDIIFCGQAFHWFDKKKTKDEFDRILKDKSNIILVWNSRSKRSVFLNEYEKVLYTQIEAYKNVNHRNIQDSEIAEFFNPKPLKVLELVNQQKFDLEGLKGRLKSSSYCPKEGEAFKSLMKRIDRLFEKYQNNDEVLFEYETKMYCC